MAKAKKADSESQGGVEFKARRVQFDRSHKAVGVHGVKVAVLPRVPYTVVEAKPGCDVEHYGRTICEDFLAQFEGKYTEV